MRAPQSATIDIRKEDARLAGRNSSYKEPKISLIKLGQNYEATKMGITIKNTSRNDEGNYICRVRVDETGQLEERIINLEVCRALSISIHASSYLGD